jgi:hypothetical protein
MYRVLKEDLDSFEKKLTGLINQSGLENWSDTPDFILAKYLRKCLETYNVIARKKAEWYSRPIDTNESLEENGSPRFVKCHDDIMYDSKTNLEWTRISNSENYRSLSNLLETKYSLWRLPSLRELQVIYAEREACQQADFGFPNSRVWSSTTEAGMYISLNFSNGEETLARKDSLLGVLLVR